VRRERRQEHLTTPAIIAAIDHMGDKRAPDVVRQGRRSVCPPLPWTVNSPVRQSTLSSSTAATSHARNPTRDNRIRIAKSRRTNANAGAVAQRDRALGE
jgi:hypothetical protein